jgi:hypothetical protein
VVGLDGLLVGVLPLVGLDGIFVGVLPVVTVGIVLVIETVGTVFITVGKL